MSSINSSAGSVPSDVISADRAADHAADRAARAATEESAAGVDAPLEGIRIVLIGVNVPGPVAAARLAEMGAAVTKVEPTGGDQLERLCPDWYHSLHRNIET